MRIPHAVFLALLLAAPSLAAKPDAPAAPGKLVIPPRITDIAKAGEAAYKARDAARVLEAYSQWIADGEVPESHLVHDRLALALEKLNPVTSQADFYWKLAEKSSQLTFRDLCLRWNAAARHPTDADIPIFKQALAFGDWSTAYMDEQMARFHAERQRPRAAGEWFDKAIALEPSMSALSRRGAQLCEDDKDRKRGVALLRRAAALGESRGQIDRTVYRTLRESDPDFMKLLSAYTLDEQFRRGRLLGEHPEPLEQAAKDFADSNHARLAILLAIVTPTAQTRCWEAVDRLRAGDRAFAKIDSLFAAGLALDPAHAGCLIERVTTLLELGRTAEAVASAEAGLKLASANLKYRAHEQLARALIGAGRFEDAYRQADMMLALRPVGVEALEQRVRALAGMGRLDDALYWSAVWVAQTQDAAARTLRGDLFAQRGEQSLAAYNYLLAMKQDPSVLAECYPRWSAAIETYRAEHCATAPRNLRESLEPNRMLVRSPGDLRPMTSPWGITTQREPDGRLRITRDNGFGILLATDGIEFSYLSRGVPVAGVHAPRDVGGGRREYMLNDEAMIWSPDGSIYVGSRHGFAPAWQGVWFDCAGVSYGGPFLGGIPAQFVEVVAESTTKEMRDGREWTTIRKRLTGGTVDVLVKGYLGSKPTEFRTLELSGRGTFRGTFYRDRTPCNGLYIRTDGHRDIVHEGQIRSGAAPGHTDYWRARVGGIWAYYLGTDDVLEFRSNLGSMVEDVVRYFPDGRPPQSSSEDVVWIHELPAPEPDEPADGAVMSGSTDFGSSLREVPIRRACYRCKGTGMIWIAGGASQTSLSTPGYLSGRQAESWRNSSASIGTVYTSGHMGMCPVCKGEGGW